MTNIKPTELKKTETLHGLIDKLEKWNMKVFEGEYSIQAATYSIIKKQNEIIDILKLINPITRSDI